MALPIMYCLEWSKEGLSLLASAVLEAQDKGFAEADPDC